MPAPRFDTIKQSKHHPISTEEMREEHEKRYGKLPSKTHTVSHKVLAKGKSAKEALKLDHELDQLTALLDQGDENDPLVQNAQAKARERFVISPISGMSSIISKVMVDSGFQPWTMISTQESLPNQEKAFNDFITAIQKYGYDSNDMSGSRMVFSLIESEVKLVKHENTNFEDLIDAVTNLVKDASDTAVKVGTAVASENPSGAGDISGDMGKIISSVANIVNVATTKDTYSETSSMCHCGVIHSDDDAEEMHQLTWSSFFTYLSIQESKHKGKKVSSEELLVAYVKFGFNISAWEVYIANEQDISTAKQLMDTTTPANPDNQIDTDKYPLWREQVTSKIQSDGEDGDSSDDSDSDGGDDDN